MQDCENPNPVWKIWQICLLLQLLPWEINPKADIPSYGKQSEGG